METIQKPKYATQSISGESNLPLDQLSVRVKDFLTDFSLSVAKLSEIKVYVQDEKICFSALVAEDGSIISGHILKFGDGLVSNVAMGVQGDNTNDRVVMKLSLAFKELLTKKIKLSDMEQKTVMQKLLAVIKSPDFLHDVTVLSPKIEGDLITGNLVAAAFVAQKGKPELITLLAQDLKEDVVNHVLVSSVKNFFYDKDVTTDFPAYLLLKERMKNTNEIITSLEEETFFN